MWASDEPRQRKSVGLGDRCIIFKMMQRMRAQAEIYLSIYTDDILFVGVSSPDIYEGCHENVIYCPGPVPLRWIAELSSAKIALAIYKTMSASYETR